MQNIKSIKFQLSHVLFSLLFTSLLFIVSNALNLDKITKWFYLGDSIDYPGLIAYLLIGQSVFLLFFLILAHRWTIKPLAIILIILSGAATYFISKYNVAIDRTMVMNALYTDTTEASGLLSIYMLPYAFFLILLPIIFVLKVKITFQSPIRYLFASLKLMLLAFLITVGLLYTQFDSIQRAGNISNKYIIHSLVPVNIIRSIISVVSHSIEPYILKNKKQVIISGTVTQQQDLVVVLAVGETSRQKSFTLYGYDRKNTTPELAKYTNLHLLNGIASIGTTLYALPEILEKKDVKLAAITSKLGIDTSCYVNYTLYDNCTSVGEIAVKNCAHGGRCYDEDVIPLLHENLKSYRSGYRFVVLHLGGGSHGPSYKDRHPAEFQRFKPMCLEADVVNQCTLEQLYNSYDNTILYVDYVLDNIIKKLDESAVPYVFIYLSDHGESLLENGHIFHGMPPGIALPPEQAQIPLIIKSSVPISIVKRDEYTQQDVFDTVLSLFSIETDILDKERNFIIKGARAVKSSEASRALDL